MANHRDKGQAQEYVRNERSRLQKMLVKMMKYYEDNGIAYQCKESAGHSFEKNFDFDPEKMQLQNREFMKAPREVEKPKKNKHKPRKTTEFDDFLATSDNGSEDERGASSSRQHRKQTAPGTGSSGSKQGVSSSSSKQSGKQTPDVRAMFDSSALDENGENDSDNDSGMDEYEDCEAENDMHRSMDEVSRFSQAQNLTWVQWETSPEFICASTGQAGQFYVSDNVHAKDSLRIHNLLIKRYQEKKSFGRFRVRFKIVNIYLTKHGESDLNWLAELIKKLSDAGNVVSAQPAKNGEFDLIKINGMQNMNEDRKEALTVYLTGCIEDLPKEKGIEVRALEAEMALVETLHYEYIKPGTCACGCGVPAEAHRCTACKEAFFPQHLRKEDEMRDGLCQVCDLVDQEPYDQSPDDIARNGLSPVINNKVNACSRRRVIDDDDTVEESPSKRIRSS